MSVITDQFSSPIEALPAEMYHIVLRHLTPLELLTNRVVSHAWDRLLTSPQVMSLEALNCRVIDEPVWRTHASKLIERGNLSLEGTQPIDKRDFSTRLEVCKFLADQERAGLQIERNRGVTLMTIPARLTIDLLRAEFHAEFEHSMDSIWPAIVAQLGAIPVDKAFQVIMTNNVLESTQDDKEKNTRGKSIVKQRVIVGNAGCVLPPILVAMTLALLTNRIDPTIRLFGNEPKTFIRCDEEIEFPLVVGGFATSGLNVICYNPGFECDGAAGMRKFNPLALGNGQ